MKRVTALFLAIILAFSLSACISVDIGGYIRTERSGNEQQYPSENKPDQFGDEESEPTESRSENNEAPAPIESSLLVEPVEKISYATTSDSVYIQDICAFIDGELSIGKHSNSGSYVVQNLSGDREDLEIIRAYIQVISNGYNLKLVSEHEQTYSSSTFFSWGLNYTGSANLTDKTGVTYTDDEATVTLYGTIENNRLKMALWIPQQMQIVDMGLRCNGQNMEISTGGPSATAGLVYYSNNTFETTDGRLSVGINEATVIRDGDICTAEAQYVYNTASSREELWVRSFYRDESLFFCSPIDRIMTGDIYTKEELTQTDDWVNKDNRQFGKLDDFGAYRWTLFFGVGHDGHFITPLFKTANEFEAATVRIMYYEKNVVAVYYIYAAFTSAPYEYEALCAVDLSNGNFTDADGEYTISAGQTITIDCPHREFGPNYELFQWEVIQGEGTVELTDTISPTCKVKGVHTGTVQIRISYNYGIDEPDVLTGYLRNSDRTKTYTFVVHVE